MPSEGVQGAQHWKQGRTARSWEGLPRDGLPRGPQLEEASDLTPPHHEIPAYLGVITVNTELAQLNAASLSSRDSATHTQGATAGRG